jgi:FdrA protein
VSWRSRVLGDRYADSVRLMGVAARLRERDGIARAEVFMGTPANLAALAELGGEADARPSDLVIALEGADVDAAFDEAERLLAAAADHGDSADVADPPRSLGSALGRVIGANIALISVPGEYATLEAHRALSCGLHVLLFSDHVPVADEVALKHRAVELGLLVMGPECGTAMLGGVGLGFANEVPRGPVGIVAAAGTGAQEAACLVAAHGSGVSHIVGVGGRDLSSDVGGLMFRSAMALLADDPGTETLLLVSKPPDRETVQTLATELPTDRRVVAAFIGLEDPDLPLEAHGTLEAAAAAATGAAPEGVDELQAQVDAARDRSAGRRLLGLFTGGTLAHEAATILRPVLGPIGGEPDDQGHAIVDLGDDRYTQGRPHPMVDPTLRRELLAAAADDGRTGCVLLDVVCGHAAHPDPAGAIAEQVAAAARRAVVVVARVCGTAADPQDAGRQAATLRAAGALVAPSNAAAARLAGRAVAGAAA